VQDGSVVKLDPFAVVARARVRGLPRPTATFLAVYSAKNLCALQPLVVQASAASWDIRLWCLDEPPKEMSRWTVGWGKGSRGLNYNRLAADVAQDRYLVLCDDDVRLQLGGLERWLRLSAALGFDISQPGHGLGSFAAHDFVRRSRRVLARETTFVEMGPLVALSPRVRPYVLPLPEEGYGWGLELSWSDLRVDGFTLGIVDAIPMWHLTPPAAFYDREIEERRQQELFALRGLSRWSDMQETVRGIHWV
jgi:hypothetical protein